jgi:hypothetical protein
VRKKLIGWERPLRRADHDALGAAAPGGDILAARVADEGVKFALIADDPSVFLHHAPLRRLPRGAGPAGGDRRSGPGGADHEAWLAQAPKTLARRFSPDRG